MKFKRTHIVIPEQLATRIDSLVGKRGRSALLANAAQRELRRRQQLAALEAAIGAWKDEDHPEPKQGAARWVRMSRRPI